MISLRDVTVRYGARMILDGVSLDIASGECVGLLGPSGTGKSTLLRVIAGEQLPSAGDVSVADWSPTRNDRSRRPPPGLLGIVYQDPVSSLDRLWCARRCIAEPLLATACMTRDERDRRTEQALSRVRLGHIDPDTRVTRLSVGQAQRVALARALVAEPRVLLADEPTSALDPTTAASIIRLLREAADAGAAVLIVSHNPTLLACFCDRGVALADARLQPVTTWPTDSDAVAIGDTTAGDSRPKQEQSIRE